MSKFLLIDHSLKGVGGHHFEYAAHLLAAAKLAGYETQLATNRRFRPGTAYRDLAAIHSVFRYGTYSKYTVYRSRAKPTPKLAAVAATSSIATPAPAITWRQRIGDWLHARGRQRRIAAFTAGLHQLFKHIALQSGDQVFIPTLSELDLVGLVAFLRDHPASLTADWHLQFHYAIFDGREPDYERQSLQLIHMRDAFAAAIAQVPRHRLHCYNTTAQLTDQYNRMGVLPFHTLPYPVNEMLRSGPSQTIATTARSTDATREPQQTAPAQLRVTSLGAIRAEKGAGELAALVASLWTTHFRNGRCQLVVQSNKKRFRLPLPEPIEKLRSEAAGTVGKPIEPVVYAPHPLAMDAYVDMICRSDIGLLLYDSDRYYVRCSGVLVELLTVGTPVIASAGCWMAEQLAESLFAHADAAQCDLKLLSSVRLPNVRSTCAATIQLPPPDAATHALISFRRGEAPGTYVRIALRPGSSSPKSSTLKTEETATIVGARRSAPVRALLPLAHHDDSPSRDAPLQLSLTNAYGTDGVRLTDVTIDYLSAAYQPTGSYPLGAVGLLAADPSQVPRLLADMIAHWPHYRRTALAFAQSWSEYHHAGRIVEELANHARTAQRQAA